MRKIILQEFVTLDGYAAGLDGNTKFFEFLQGEAGKAVDEVLYDFIGTLDGILLGANTYRMFVEYWPDVDPAKEIVAERLNRTPKYVFSQHLPDAPWGKWEPAKLIREEPVEFLRKLKAGDGKDFVIWGSLKLAQSLMKSDVIDEYQFRVCPSALGNGLPVFTAAMDDFELIETRAFDSGVVMLNYRRVAR